VKKKVEKVENRVESLIRLKWRTIRRKSGDVSGKNTNKTGIMEKKRIVRTETDEEIEEEIGKYILKIQSG